MPKIDTSLIDGYAEMSAEDKLKALEAYEFEAPKPDTTEADKLKAALNKASADAAEWKRQYREKQTEQEREAAERAEREQATMTELEALRKERAIDKLEKQYLGAGYSAELAANAAKAMADGDTETVLKMQMAFLDESKRSWEAAALANQKGLSVGTPPKAETEEDKIVNMAMKYAGLTP